MKTSLAIWNKQCKDTLRNFPTLIILIIYPIVAFIMISAMRVQDGANEMFLAMFATMHCCFAPAVTAANMLAEEKEKGTLRSLILSGVSRVNYLASTALFVMAAVMLTGGTFLLMDRFGSEYILRFWAAMLCGTVISTLLGLCIGIDSQNVAAANGMAVPVGLAITLIPMLAQFNDGIAKIARWLYSGQISMILRNGETVSLRAIVTCLVYLSVLWLTLLLLFRKKGLE